MRHMSKQHRSAAWFVRTRDSYLPQTWQGWALYVPYLAYLISVTAYAFYESGTLLQKLFVIVPNYVAALAIMTWVAERTAK